MGNTTEALARSRMAAEVASRIAVRLNAQRVELFRVGASEAEIVARWLEGSGSAICAGSSMPLTWFPWSLGNIHSEEYMFVRNAGALRVDPASDRTIADVGMSSVVHVPVASSPGVPIGAICAYWSVERSSWEVGSRELLCSWVLDALSTRR